MTIVISISITNRYITTLRFLKLNWINLKNND